MIYHLYFICLILLFVFSVFISKAKLITLKGNIGQVYDENGFKWGLTSIIPIILIGLVAAIRNEGFGTDYQAYYEFYEYIYQNGEFKPGPLIGDEIGWNYMNLLFGKMNCPPNLFFGIVTAFTWGIFCKGSNNYQLLLPLMLFFVFSSGFFYWTLSGLRQSIAIMIFFFSIKFIIERNFLLFVLSVLTGSLFHYSILIFLPSYFIIYLNYNKNFAILSYLISLLLIGTNFIQPIAAYFLSIFGNVVELNLYTHYLNQEHMLVAAESSGTNLGFVLKSIFILYILSKSKKIIKLNPNIKVYFILFAFFAILQNLFFSFELAERLLNYLFICFPLVAAATIYYSFTKVEKIVSLIFLCSFSCLFLMASYKFTYNSLLL